MFQVQHMQGEYVANGIMSCPDGAGREGHDAGQRRQGVRITDAQRNVQESGMGAGRIAAQDSQSYQIVRACDIHGDPSDQLQGDDGVTQAGTDGTQDRRQQAQHQGNGQTQAPLPDGQAVIENQPQGQQQASQRQ